MPLCVKLRTSAASTDTWSKVFGYRGNGTCRVCFAPRPLLPVTVSARCWLPCVAGDTCPFSGCPESTPQPPPSFWRRLPVKRWPTVSPTYCRHPHPDWALEWDWCGLLLGSPLGVWPSVLAAVVHTVIVRSQVFGETDRQTDRQGPVTDLWGDTVYLCVPSFPTCKHFSCVHCSVGELGHVWLFFLLFTDS